jgi:hypothetical protein
MQHDRRDLDALFAPEPNQFGTHMLICGLSADIETLERITSAFTGQSKVQRAASGLLRSVLMLDASARLLSPLAVPGMLQLAPCAATDWKQQTSLMHAKVALMGYAESPFGAPTALRLVVSTGNWTRETWGSGSQIDMFWTTTCKTLQPGERPTQAHADIAAALAFFEQMMSALYPQSIDFLQKQPLAMTWLEIWKAQLSWSRANRPANFIHSLEKPLFDQIKKHFPKSGICTLVAGSGFFEQASKEAAGKPKVLAKLEELGKPGKRFLVSNASQAGALAGWIGANLKKAASGELDGWNLCAPADPLQPKQTLARTFLHAKYIAGLKRVYRSKNDTGTLGALYIGSGNLSRAGLLTCASLGASNSRRRHTGNIEAGIFMDEELVIEQVWHALARGKPMTPEAMKAMVPGDSEPIFEPRDPPPVLFAQAASRRLHLVRAEPQLALQLKIIGTGDWLDIQARQEDISLPDDSIPPIVWVRLPATHSLANPEVHEVPVFSEDGVLCRQLPAQLSADDVLDALLAFPAAPPYLADPNVPVQASGKSGAVASDTAKCYPLRLLASMIEAIGQRNCVLTIEQFPFWLSQLRVLLLQQVSEADRSAVQQTGIDLFPALHRPGFAPPWLNGSPALKASYETLIGDIQRAWTLSRAVVCPAPATQLVHDGEALEEEI